MESRIVGKICKHFYCAICSDVMTNAVSLQCGHEFCEKCITHTIKVCPLCRSNSTDYVPSYEKRRRISALKIKCVNNGKGCEFFDAQSRISQHELICEYNEKKQVEEKKIDTPIKTTEIERPVYVRGRPLQPRGTCLRCWDYGIENYHLQSIGLCESCCDYVDSMSVW